MRVAQVEQRQARSVCLWSGGLRLGGFQLPVSQLTFLTATGMAHGFFALRWCFDFGMALASVVAL